MADQPWDKKLTPGQVRQKLRELHCVKLDAPGLPPTTEYWRPPVGEGFNISIEDCYPETLEAIVEYIRSQVPG